MDIKESEIVCRACLSNSSTTYYDIHDNSYETRTFKDLFEGLTSFAVKTNEPSFVCEACAIRLEESFKFKQMLEETQLILIQMGSSEVIPKQDDAIIQEDLIEEVQVQYEAVDEAYVENPPDMKPFDITNCLVEVIDKEFVCMFCEKQFTKERGLFDHLQRYHRDKKTIECKLCKRFFYTTEYLNEHTSRCFAVTKPKSDQLSECPECGKTGERNLIRKHITNHRRKRDGPFQCDLCKIWLKSKECVTNHMKAKHLHRKFPCKYCEKSYSSRSGHDQHVQQYHTKDQTYNCKMCPYKTHSKTLLRKHELRHTTIASFSCTVCNSAFVSLENLRRHQFVHTDARPCICEVCSRGFKNKEALKKHQAIHQEYRYECPICVRKYLTNQAMRNHCTKNHPDYKLPPLGTVLAADAKLKLTTEMNAKLQKSVLMPNDEIFGLITY